MSRRGILCPLKNLLVCSVLLSFPVMVAGQRYGGGQAGSTGLGGTNGFPSGLDEKDNRAGFHHALAVQATARQIAEYRALIKTTDEAKAKANALAQPGKAAADPDAAADLSKALARARTGTKTFVDGFSDAQKSGLKDLTRRLDKADSDLEAEEKKLDLSVQANSGAAALQPQAASVGKALTDFSDQQLALGREMNITLAADTPAYTLATIKGTARIGDQTILVPVSGMLMQTTSNGPQHTLKLEVNADLQDLQQSIGDVLRPQLDRGEACGERLALRQAAIVPAPPAGVLTLRLHYERWSCMRIAGQSANELAEGDGLVDIKLTPGVEKSALKLTAEFARIDASGMMGESLRSGDLGEELRHKVSDTILTAMQAGANAPILPPAVKSAAVIQSAHFQATGAGRLTLVLDGEIEASADQISQLAAQLGQNPAAPGTTTP